MRLFCSYLIGMLIFAGVCAGVEDDSGTGTYAHITQDRVRMDFDTGDLFFNDDPIDLEELGGQLKKSYSIAFSAVSFSGDPKPVPVRHLLAVLDRIDQSGIDAERVRLNLFLSSKLIEGTGNGAVLFDRDAVSVDPTKKPSSVFRPIFKGMTVDYRELLAVLRARGERAVLVGLTAGDRESITVRAQIYQVQPDGSRDVLSAPMQTAKAGRTSMIRVVTNGSGRNPYRSELDDYHQEDLANLGIRFSVHPLIIGDYVRVSGVVILTKQLDRVGVFVQDDVPVASYSCAKTVVPFSVIFPPNQEFVEFAVAEVGGKPTMCRLSARVVDDKGMTRSEREGLRLKP